MEKSVWVQVPSPTPLKKDDNFSYHLFHLKNDEGFNPFLWVQCEQAETGVFLL